MHIVMSIYQRVYINYKQTNKVKQAITIIIIIRWFHFYVQISLKSVIQVIQRNILDMGQFQNVLRGNLFIWFMVVLIFAFFTVLKLIKKLLDFQQGGAKPQQIYVQGQKPKQSKVIQSHERFDATVVMSSKDSEDDTVLQRWIKKVNQFAVYYMPMLFPFALNVMTGTTYVFLIIIFFFSLFSFIIFNVLKLHRQCVDNPVLRVIIQNLSYILSFFLLLNVWPTGTNDMPYVVIKQR